MQASCQLDLPRFVGRIAVCKLKNSVMFALGSSSSGESSSGRTNVQRPPIGNTQTSSSKAVAVRAINEEPCEDGNVFEFDDEGECAIDEDDGDVDWEDTNTESGQAIFDEIWPERIAFEPKLPTHKSLLTIQLAGSRSAPAFDQSNTSSTVDPYAVSSPDSENYPPPMLQGIAIANVPRQTDSQPGQALSPHTARQNMLANEMTVSLRENLLWARQRKSQAVNAIPKLRNTTDDVANLKQHLRRAT